MGKEGIWQKYFARHRFIPSLAAVFALCGEEYSYA
jgi:hypothetical protein